MKIIKIKINSQGELTPFIYEEMGFLMSSENYNTLQYNCNINKNRKDINNLQNFYNEEDLKENSLYIYPNLNTVKLKIINYKEEIYIFEEKKDIFFKKLTDADIRKEFLINCFLVFNKVKEENIKQVKEYIIEEFLPTFPSNNVSTIQDILIRFLGPPVSSLLILEEPHITNKFIKNIGNFINMNIPLFDKSNNGTENDSKDFTEENYIKLVSNYALNTEVFRDTSSIQLYLSKYKIDTRNTEHKRLLFLIFYEFIKKNNITSSFGIYSSIVRDAIDLIDYETRGGDYYNTRVKDIQGVYNISDNESIFKTISLDNFLNFRSIKRNYSFIEDIVLDCISVY